jgi:methanogenic corrinoid protein MtbC1
MENTISSRKAADILKVNESTIKRWADSGYLKCFKSPGGHRKFKIEDIRDLATDYNLDTEIISPLNVDTKLKVYISQRNTVKLNDLFAKLILAGDLKRSYSLIYTLFMNNFSLAEIFDKIMSTTMADIGNKWSNKTLGVEKEHIASNTAIALLHQFEKNIQTDNQNGKIIICAGLEDELHEIGLLCVKICLEHSGCKVIYPGINLPLKSLKTLLKENKPDVLCISSTYNPGDKKLKKHFEDIKNLCKKSGTKIFTGGVVAKQLIGDNRIIYCKGIEELMKRIDE